MTQIFRIQEEVWSTVFLVLCAFMLAVLSITAALAWGKGEAGCPATAAAAWHRECKDWASGFLEKEGRSVNTLKCEFMFRVFAVAIFYEALWKFTARADALEMATKISKGKAAEIEELKCEYMYLIVYSIATGCTCVCLSKKMIVLLLFAGDNKVKDTKIIELQLRLRETESKCTCMWTHTNAMWSLINAKKVW